MFPYSYRVGQYVAILPLLFLMLVICFYFFYILNFINAWFLAQDTIYLTASCALEKKKEKKQVYSSVTGYNVLRTDLLYPYWFFCQLVQTISVGRVKIFNFIFEFGLFLSLVLSVLLHFWKILLLSTYMFKIMFSCWDYPL